MRAKSYLVLLSLTLMLLLPSLATARPVHNFDCSQCHLSNLTIDELGGGNVCLTCHDDTPTPILLNIGTSPTPGGNFVEGDASNQYGNNPSPGDQTSHNWAATSTNPAAGAVEPNRALHPGFYGRYGTTDNRVACSRCHEPHAQIETNPKLLKMEADRVTPLTADAMCLACHDDFNIDGTMHGLVSHPVGVSYADAVTANPGDYQPAPVDIANSDLTLMADGSISCTTCHGVHFVDSDATTPDTVGAVGVGDGLLLKHNGPSDEDPVAKDGICQACHIYEGHGMSGANNVGCMVCHGGHAYDPVAPNYYMLNKQVDLPFVPKLGGPGTVNLDYTVDPTTVPDYSNGTGTNGDLCLACHALPGTHNATDACADCHGHDSTTGSFGAGCGSCHGYAPFNNDAGNLGTGGYAVSTANPTHDYSSSPAYKNEANTPHATHANGGGNYTFSCFDCHGDGSGVLSDLPGAGNHDGDTFQQVLDTAIGTLPSLTTGNGRLTGGSAPDYLEGGNGSCDNVYCHSNGVAQRADNTLIPVAVGTWNNGNGTISDCTSCHIIGGANDTPTHTAHIANYACVTCHSDTATNATTLVGTAIGTTHVNGQVDAVFSGIATNATTTTYDDTQGTCSTYCHSSGQAAAPAPVQNPDWDLASTGQCGDCHGTDTVSPAALSAAHETHFDEGVTACNTCHTHDGSLFTGDHINGAKDVTADVCNTCHGTTTAGTGVDAYPVWTNTASVTCNTCHQGVLSTIGGDTAPATDGTATNAHSDTCTACHTSTTDVQHLDGTQGNTLRLIAANSTAACNSCHGVGGSVGTMNNIITHQAKNCATCHDPHYGGSNLSLVRPTSADYTGTVVFTAITGANSYDENDGANADDICATCHTAGNQTQQHNNSTNAGVAHNEGTDCFACHLPHTNSPSAFAVGGGDSCDGCHGYPPATAAHNEHSPDSDTLDTAGKVYRDGTNGFADVTSCAFCHTGADSYTYNTATDQGNSLNHANPAGRVTILGTSVGYDGSTCASACHDGATGVTAAWTDASLDCAACHYQSATPTQAANTSDNNTISAGHNAHFNSSAVCTDCHAAAADTAHITDRSGATELAKIQGMAIALQDEAAIIAGNGFNDGANTCSTASCHNDARPGNDVVTAAWGTDQANCTQCHAAAPSTGSHTKHIPAATDCSDCHTSALQDTSYNSGNHFDGDIDVAIGSYTNNKGINTAFESCDAPSCHDDGRAPTATPNWGTAVTTCLACHEAIPSTGSHAAHVADAAVACTDCHAGAVQETTEPTAGHEDGNIDVTAAHTYNANPNLGGAFDTCSTASCHDTGRNSGLTDVWGTALANCSECHPTVPTTGGHTVHLAASVAGTTIACGDCHAGATQGTTAPTANHRDGDTNATAYPVTTNGGAFQNCATAACHQTGQAANDYTATSLWGADDANCTQCHAATPATGSHDTHVNTAGYDCSQCHTGATKDTSYSNANHGDAAIDVAVGNYITNRGDADYGTAYTTCDTISCHGDGLNPGGANTPVWGAAAGCAACHDTVNDGTGSHAVHLTYTSDACVACHDNADVAGTAPGQHGDGDVDVFDSAAGDLGYPQDAAIGNTSWTGCTAASCHDDGRSPNTTPNWGTAASNACTACHETVPATGSHVSHVADSAVACTDCHAGAVQGTTKPTAGHDDGNIDVTAAHTYNANPNLGGAFDTCSTASCHDTGRNSGGLTDVWGTGKASCGECHDVAPTTGSHTAHLSDVVMNVACNDCHTGVTEGTTAGAGHRDGSIDTIGGLSYNANPNLGGAFDTCSTASCHNDGRNSGLTPAWGTARNNCSDCHATVPTTGSHTDHLALFACGDCHSGTTQGTTAGAGHLDGNIDTANTGLTANKVNGTAYTSCGTSNCHGSNSPVWGTDLDGNDACTQCHGELVAGPATDSEKAPGGAGVDTNGDSAATDAQVGAHQVHLNSTISAPIACSACHTVPATITAAGHIDSALPAELTWSGIATANSTTPTSCATTYCHDGGAIKNGWDGGTLAPVWNDTNFSQGTVADCDNCHGYPPAGAHSSNTDCSACHDTLNADDVTFTAAGKLAHVDGNVTASGGDTCTDCHGADIDGGLNGVHSSHVDTATFLAGKSISSGDYGTNGWYGTTYVNGQPQFGCGQCHPAANGSGHFSDGLDLDIDPAGETPGAGNVKTMNAAQSTPTYSTRSSVTCASVYCHSNAAGSFQTTPDWYGGALPTDGTECASCHGNSPDTNAHEVHVVGIHFEELYDDDGVGLMAAGGASNAAHGDSATADAINCNSCHNDTVTVITNSASDVGSGTSCFDCHGGATGDAAAGNELMTIDTASTSHINGIADVVFDDLTTFKSKAQLRNDIALFPALDANWDRPGTSYKAPAGTSFDQAKVSPTFSGGTCSTVACHNGIDAAWTDPVAGNCMKCHTVLPQ